MHPTYCRSAYNVRVLDAYWPETFTEVIGMRDFVFEEISAYPLNQKKKSYTIFFPLPKLANQTNKKKTTNIALAFHLDLFHRTKIFSVIPM
jgi:hypothetical protein